MNSPFKFLDPFGPKDRDVFFGRDEEIEALYELALRGRLLLVYGLSGTGKTSLVQCGLRNRFDNTDWLPIFVRRGDNINRSLEEELAKKAGDRTKKDNLVDKVASIYKYNLRPVYIIVDQLEELFILGDEAERDKFIQSLQDLLQSGLDYQIILIIREYLGRLYPFEKKLPSLFNYRLRVEPMNFSNVEKVITGSCAQFNITLEEPKRNIRQIMDNVSSGKAVIQLPYLQVYLDRLWREVYEHSRAKNTREPHPEDVSEDGFPPLTFTSRDIDELGQIEDVLEQFLHSQENDISKRLMQQYPNLPDQPVRQVLDLFVTEEGTKRPALFSRKEGQPLQLKEIEHTPAAQLPQDALQEALTALDKARILRIGEQQIELAHDSLAVLIDRDRSIGQRQRNQIKREVKFFYKAHQKGGPFLTRKMVRKIRYGFPDLQLEPELEKYIDESEANYEREKREKAAQQQREQKMRRQRVLLGLISAALVIALGLFVWALREKAKADRFASAFFESEAEKFAWAYDFENKKFEIINRSGTIIGDYLWEDPQQFHNGIAIARRNGQYHWLEGGDTISKGYSWLHPTDENVYLGIIGLKRVALDPLDGESKDDVKPSVQSLKEDTMGDGMWLNPFQSESKYGFKNLSDDIIILPKYEIVQTFFDGLAPVKMNEKWGYIDQSGLRIGSALFDQPVLEMPYKGTFRIQETGKQGIAHISGEEILFPQYQSISDFSEDLASVNKKGKWGFINVEGREVIRPVFSNAGNFSEEVAAVQVGESWGFIDKKGQLVIDPTYSYCSDFSGGLARVQQNGLWGFVDKKGRMVISPIFENAGDFTEGKTPVQKNGLWGFIDKNGGMVIPPEYEFAGNFKAGRAPVQEGGMWGIIEENGAIVSSSIYEFTGIFSEGRARVQKDALWGFIDLNGKEVISLDFEYAENFAEGRARVLKDGLWGIIDSTGKFILPNNYSRIEQIGAGKFLVVQGNTVGLIAFQNDSISGIARRLPCEYESIGFLQDDYLMVKKDGKWGFVFWNDDTVEPVKIIPCRYDAVTPFSEDGFARGFVDEFTMDFYINRKGEMLVNLSEENSE
jgi:hypothetical protein